MKAKLDDQRHLAFFRTDSVVLACLMRVFAGAFLACFFATAFVLPVDRVVTDFFAIGFLAAAVLLVGGFGASLRFGLDLAGVGRGAVGVVSSSMPKIAPRSSPARAPS